MSEENQPAQETPDAGDKLYDKQSAEGDEKVESKADESAEDKAEEKPEDQSGDAKSDDESDSEQADDDEESDKESDDESSDEQQKDKSEEIKLERPKDTDLTDEHVKKIEAFAKDKGLSQEVAKEVLEMQHELLRQQKESATEALEEVKETWKSEASKDKELGGERFEKNVELAKRAVERFGTEKFMDDLDHTGFGNHPELLRVFYRIGKAMGDGDFVRPGTQAKSPKTYEQIFYGEQTNT